MTAPVKYSRRHGTRSTYVTGCRCELCSEANRSYARLRDRRSRYPDVWGPLTDLVPATRARARLRKLQRLGMGTWHLTKLTGVSRTALLEIRSGRTKRVRPKTLSLILSIDERDLALGALVDARETWRLIDEMIASGVTKTRIARALGCKTPALQLSRTSVTVAHRDAIRQLHADWVEVDDDRRFDRQPVIEYIERLLKVPGSTWKNVAERLGQRGSFTDFKKFQSLTRDKADEIACCLGLHPRELWPEWDDELDLGVAS